MKRPFKLIASLCVTVLLSACEVGPDYERPPVDVPKVYKEQGDWKPALPQDDINRGPWWAVYKDPALDDLEKQIDISNQNLKAAEAAFRNASAVVAESRAALFPTISLDATGQKTGSTGHPPAKPHNLYNAAGQASWVPDIWGSIRRTIESDVANAQASAADIASARLSAQAELATDYFDLRAQDELLGLLDATVVELKHSLQITQNQYDSGVADQADVLLAQTQLEGVEAQYINAGVQRAQLEHAIAILIGKSPADFTLAAAPLAYDVPVIPTDLPSTLLERRPDIAAAERQMVSANAQIGVETAAFFPNLTLSASYGYTATALSKLFQASNSLWAFGPAVGETIFDAGAREARVEEARASYDQAVANYRQTVLTGFQQVEDQLAALRILEKQSVMNETVVKDAQRSQELVLNQYKAGIVPYTSVITAQTTALTDEQTELTTREDRFNASVSLIEAVGGGWNATQLPTSDKIDIGN